MNQRQFSDYFVAFKIKETSGKYSSICRNGSSLPFSYIFEESATIIQIFNQICNFAFDLFDLFFIFVNYYWMSTFILRNIQVHIFTHSYILLAHA